MVLLVLCVQGVASTEGIDIERGGMLFITNRVFNEGHGSFSGTRSVSFDLDDHDPRSEISFCRRRGKGAYEEMDQATFQEAVKSSGADDVIFFAHGFNNLPERERKQGSSFEKAVGLQVGFNRKYASDRKRRVMVVPVIWPCDRDDGFFEGFLNIYKDDQDAALDSRVSLAKALRSLKDIEWPGTPPVLHLAAHSMGNRVLVRAIEYWEKHFVTGSIPKIFKTVFMIAADVPDDELRRGEHGEDVPRTTETLGVYYAKDDKALWISVLANLCDWSKRLETKGPKSLGKHPRNVYAADCDPVNDKLDRSFVDHTGFVAQFNRGVA